MNATRFLAICLTLAASACPLSAAETATELSAADLASRLSAQRENTSTRIRLRMEVQQPAGTKKNSFQIQIKERRTPAAADVVYLILWPKERKGEALIIRQVAGKALVASQFKPGEKTVPVDASASVFGSGLAVADTIENFFAWKNQALVGTEVINNVNCQILESKPGSGDSSIYGHVRTWVDTRRLVPLRVEKYLPSGQLARRIDTTHVVRQGDVNLPANLAVRDAKRGSLTVVEGSTIRRGITFSDSEFTPAGLDPETELKSSSE